MYSIVTCWHSFHPAAGPFRLSSSQGHPAIELQRMRFKMPIQATRIASQTANQPASASHGTPLCTYGIVP